MVVVIIMVVIIMFMLMLLVCNYFRVGLMIVVFLLGSLDPSIVSHYILHYYCYLCYSLSLYFN